MIPESIKKIGTLNTRSLKKDDTLMVLTREMVECGLDILVVTETRRIKECFLYGDAFMCYFGDFDKIGGVGFLIRKDLASCVVDIRFEGIRLGRMVLRLNGNYTTIVAAYSPTNDPKYNKEIIGFYKDLDSISKSKYQGSLFICGDFNGRLLGHDININSDAGVKQGDCLSPRLFTILVQYVMCQAKLEEYCMVIDDQKLDYLAYADDLVLIAKNSKDLQNMLDNFAEEAKKVNLVLNLSKCKMMSQTTRKGPLSTCKVEIFKTPLEEVETYEYLGQIISNKNKNAMSNELSHRLRKFWKAYHVNKNMLGEKKLSLKLKVEIFKSEGIVEFISQQKLNFIGQRLRQQAPRPLPLIANWIPKANNKVKKRRVGRPCLRYFDCMKKIKDWKQIVNNNEEWSKVDYRLIT
uniref:Reverse transcriptase domain-containing protein n=1 Tax=Rhabditophanes sp. KR3021 TaxID=114890 RepID=A0AC35TQ53_9BILA